MMLNGMYTKYQISNYSLTLVSKDPPRRMPPADYIKLQYTYDIISDLLS
jgi:hypothetical protein